MSFSLLAPLGAVLAGLVALPILAHLSRQTPRERSAFGAMLLMRRMVKRLRRRRRLKDWLLLLIRGLAVLALAIAAAAPQLITPGGVPAFGGSGRVVLVIDRSLSMSLTENGETLLTRARNEATRVLGELPAGAQASVVIFDDEARTVTDGLTQDHARLAAAVAAIQPTYGGSDLRAGLHEARRLLTGEPGEVLLFSDEAGSQTVLEARPELEALVELGSTVLPMPVQANPPRNVAIISAIYGAGVDGGTLTLRLANYGPDAIEIACEVTLPDDQKIPIFADLPPEGEAEERVTIPREALGGVGVVACVDPDLATDDARYFHLPRVGASRVLVVDGDPGDTPTRSEIYFLERALAPWGGQRTGVALDVVAPSGLAGLNSEDHRIVFLANVADPRPFGPLLTEFVRKGGSLVIAAGDNVTADRYNAALGGVLPARFRSPRAIADRDEDGVPLRLPTSDHPVFDAFSSSGRSSIARIRSHQILTLEPYDDRPDEVETLLRYADGQAALVERRIGRGKVLLWTSTLDWGWTNFPLQASFMPLMQGTIRYLGGESGSMAVRLEGQVNQAVRIPLSDTAMQPTVHGPNDEPLKSRSEGSTFIFTPTEPGPYELRLADTPPLAQIAVNTDPLESDVRRPNSVAAVEREMDPERFQVKRDLALWALFAAFGLLVLQSLIALRSRGEA